MFNALISDLFPGVEIPKTDSGELLEAIEFVTLQQGLQVMPKVTLKAVQVCFHIIGNLETMHD